MLDFTTDTSSETTNSSPAITAAAHGVASATARHEAAASALTAAEVTMHQVRERIAAIESDRQAIAARRARGEYEPDDGGRLELARMDLENLATIAVEAEATAATHRDAEAEARRAMDAARNRLSRTEDEAALAALEAHARDVDAIMEATIRRAADTAARIGARVSYVPSPALAASFRRLLAAAGKL